MAEDLIKQAVGALQTPGALGGAVALGSAIYGAIQSKRENDRARRLISNQRAKNEAWYNIRMNQDYTERADAKAAINKQRELLKNGLQTARATNAVAGGTDASVAMQKLQAADSVAETTSNIAANAENYKEGVEQRYQQTDNALAQQQAQMHAQQGAAIAQAAGQGVAAGVNYIGARQDQAAQAEIERLKLQKENN